MGFLNKLINAIGCRALAVDHGVDPGQPSGDPRLPAAIVELVTWLAVLQMLHRLSRFHAG